MGQPESFEIRRAERKQARLRLALAGSSGGGKTASSLLLARGIVEEYLSLGLAPGTLEGKIGLIDTERESASLYSHLVPFDTLPLNPPHSVERYVGAMDAMERTGVLVMIVDSISPAWAGNGGVLALLDRIEDKNRFRSFGTVVNPEQDKLIDRILRSSCHVIVTMRSKTAWVIEQVEKNGRTVNQPKRIGMAPVQRPGIEFEFTTLLDLDSQTHRARAVKNRCPVFKDGEEVLLTAEVGRGLARWMQEGAPAPAEPVAGTPLERAQAVAEAACRACEKAANIPDLARVFADGEKAVKGFRGVLDDDTLRPLVRGLTAAKDERKAALGGDRAIRPVDTTVGEEPPGPINVGAGVMEERVTDEQEAQLRRAVSMAGISIADCVTQFRVARLGEIRRSSFGECLGWIASRADVGAPARSPTKASAFDDMEDDLPWRDDVQP